ncbi:hypothetical protein VP01_570g6 [Puccinia sorghi]|uniref:Peptidase M1 leukotriene A4 hydrolase/aminopeptidase C-terminal domain-containing protein n=1 Tax=Puccinia sorghi TaxID=27349 RepID=A0A0L6UIL9_9BASI|nr:hypothetical protein VP01_570g6 [Puccinia sorghi]
MSVNPLSANSPHQRTKKQDQLTITTMYAPPQDPASQSNYRDISILHAHLDWHIHWDLKTIDGSVSHTLQAHRDGISSVVLDTSFLEIKQVTILDPKSSYSEPLKIQLGQRHPVLGSALSITLPRKLALDQQITLKIEYSTTTNCTALGWLEPSKSAATSEFSSSITKDDVKDWVFEQPVKIPSYLIAIAAGELVYRKMGQRTGAWADPATIDAVYDEFASSTEQFIAAAEKIVGVEYDWGTYDVLVLPPSFPYGGMENSNLTFLTPSLLTGDKSLVDVVAHEISHSVCSSPSSLSLMSFITTSNFWIVLAISGSVTTDAERSFSYIIGRKALGDALQEFKNKDQPKFQQLEIQYDFGEDPDLAFSSVPYDKGANFLLYLEGVVGGLEVFLPYASDYVKTFKGKSLDTTMWKDHLFNYFDAQPEVMSKLKAVDWEAYALARKWNKARSDASVKFGPEDIEGFSSNQVVVFLEKLDEEVDRFPESIVEMMERNYRFNGTNNQEIRLPTWVSNKGRMKFARLAKDLGLS